MASSNKAQDPAAAALLAIEEALNLRAASESAEPGEGPANPAPQRGQAEGAFAGRPRNARLRVPRLRGVRATHAAAGANADGDR